MGRMLCTVYAAWQVVILTGLALRVCASEGSGPVVDLALETANIEQAASWFGALTTAVAMHWNSWTVEGGRKDTTETHSVGGPPKILTVRGCTCLPLTVETSDSESFWLGCGWPGKGWCDVEPGCLGAQDSTPQYDGWDLCLPKVEDEKSRSSGDWVGENVPKHLEAPLDGNILQASVDKNALQLGHEVAIITDLTEQPDRAPADLHQTGQHNIDGSSAMVILPPGPAELAPLHASAKNRPHIVRGSLPAALGTDGPANSATASLNRGPQSNSVSSVSAPKLPDQLLEIAVVPEVLVVAIESLVRRLWAPLQDNVEAGCSARGISRDTQKEWVRAAVIDELKKSRGHVGQAARQLVRRRHADSCGWLR